MYKYLLHEELFDQLFEQLKCPICLDLVQQPVSCLNDHIYCGECIARCNGENCPMCQGPLNKYKSGSKLDSILKVLRKIQRVQNFEQISSKPQLLSKRIFYTRKKEVLQDFSDESHVHILMSQVDPLFKADIISFCKRFKCHLESDFTPKVTHLLVGSNGGVCQRTLKYLLCLAKGAWILDLAWAQNSLSNGKLINEKDFLITADGVASGGPKQAIQDPTFFPSLFKDYVFTVTEQSPFAQNARLSVDQLEELLVLCGGKIECEHTKNTTDIVLSKKSPGTRVSGISKRVSALWVYDCISFRKVLDTKPYTFR